MVFFYKNVCIVWVKLDEDGRIYCFYIVGLVFILKGWD